MTNAARLFLCAGAAGLALSLALPAREAPKPPKTGAPNLPSMDFTFSPKFPHYQTAKLILRNPKKLRPLYLAGKGEDGTLAFRPADMDNLGAIASDINLNSLAGLMEIATASGAFSVRYDSLSAAPVDLERFVGTDWLKQEPRPKFSFKVQKLDDWSLAVARRGGETRYNVKLTADFTVGERKVTIPKPVVIVVVDATLDSPARLLLRMPFSFMGSELGLTGDDAGEITASLMLCGYTTMKNETQHMLQKIMVEPPDNGIFDWKH